MTREGGRERGGTQRGGRQIRHLLYFTKWVAGVCDTITHTHAERIEERKTPATTARPNYALALVPNMILLFAFSHVVAGFSSRSVGVA
jgi:hypothetical protein